MAADPPLREIMFHHSTGSRCEGWRALRGVQCRRVAGEIVHRTWPSPINDPVESYIGIRLQSGKMLEALGFRCESGALSLYLDGAMFGRIVEKELPRPKGWWKRLLGGERLWHIFLHDEFIGVVQLAYPVGNTTVLSFQLHNGVALPIRLGTEWFQPATKFVIPPATPHLADVDLETLHFVLSAVMRTWFWY
ncbi:MAG TPA: hypothetical protein VG826_05590 [Pirellulales bacterium]|nr:hypothetical protein [Pirellulales bacterium]